MLLLLFLHPGANCQPAHAAVPIDDRTAQLRQSLASAEGVGTGVSIPARQQLEGILAAPEFAEKMREPSAWERWKQQFAVWLMDWFGNLFQSIARNPTTSQAIFWAGALGSLALVAFYLFRLFRGDEMTIRPAFNVEAPRTRSAADWIAAARSAAGRGDLNTGIQCLYWAAIVFLQTAGTLPETGAHTPREFLRALPLTNSTDELRSLTSSVERFWYARMPATAGDFAACLRSVEALGCKLD